VTRKNYITTADKALWDRVRGDLPDSASKRRKSGLDGETANLIAAVLDGLASESDLRALGKRIKRDPSILDAFLAARAARYATPVDAPQALRALARHVYPDRHGNGNGQPPKPGGKRRAGWGWIAASIVALALAVGGYFVGQETSTRVADNGEQAKPPTTVDEVDLTGPNGTKKNDLFDALDMDFE
jgi:hypothetical protein